MARHYAWAEQPDKAVRALARAVESGYFNFPALERDPWLQPLRGSREFDALLQQAATRHRQAHAIFVQAGGQQFLD